MDLIIYFKIISSQPVIYARVINVLFSVSFYDQSEGIADIMKSLLGQFTSQKELDEVNRNYYYFFYILQVR